MKKSIIKNLIGTMFIMGLIISNIKPVYADIKPMIDKAKTVNNEISIVEYGTSSYKIVFDKNSATATGTMDSISVEYDTEVTLPSNTFKDTGYKFTEWNTIADGSGQTVSDNAVVKNLVEKPEKTAKLFAQWTPIKYTVTYHGNKPAAALTEVEGQTKKTRHTYGKNQKLMKNGFTLTDWEFIGWNTNADGSGTAYTDNQAVKNLTSIENANIDLYAQWKEPVYTVTFNANGGTGTMESQTISWSDQLTKITPNAFIRDNSVFMGWSLYPGSEKMYEDESIHYNNLNNDEKRYGVTPNGTITLYAVWDIIPSKDSYWRVSGTAEDGQGSSFSYTETTGGVLQDKNTVTTTSPGEKGDGSYSAIYYVGDGVNVVPGKDAGEVADNPKVTVTTQKK